MSDFARRLCVLVAFLTLFPALIALGQEEQTEAEPMTIDLRLNIPNNDDVPPQFVANVRDSDGDGVPGVSVDFGRQVELLGTTRTALLGTAVTDVGGVARLVVQPRQEQATIIATVSGTDLSSVIDVTFPPDRVDTFYNPEHEHGLLTPLRDLMPAIIATIVALLWIFVIGLVIYTVRRLRELGIREEAGIS